MKALISYGTMIYESLPTAGLISRLGDNRKTNSSLIVQTTGGISEFQKNIAN